MKMSALFERCLNINYTQAENAADYAIERLGAVLYIYFEASNGAVDWKNNLDFPAIAYERSEDGVWFAHSGFLKVWESVEKYISPAISDPKIKKIVTVGYSHGAAVAALCHEYIWYARPDLIEKIEGYGFGCPRIFFGIQTKEIRRRWKRFKVIRNLDDIVTHLPPAALGYSHVGELIEIGSRGKYTKIDAHRPENILAELHNYEKGGFVSNRVETA